MRTEEINLARAKYILKNKGNNTITLGGGFGVGHVPSIDLEKVKKSWNVLPLQQREPFTSCYAGYITTGKKLTRMKEDWKYYVAYPSMPTWFSEFVEDFNDFFDNIKIEILENKTSFMKYESVFIPIWNNKNKEEEHLSLKFDSVKGHVEITVPLVRFDYAEEYDKKVQYCFNYIIVIFVRMLNITERFYNPFYYPKGNKIKFLCGVNNKNAGYRTLSEKAVTPKELKKLDDIELMNTNIKNVYGRDSGQTRIFSGLISKQRKTISIKKLSTAKRIDDASFVFADGCTCRACRTQRSKQRKGE